MTRATDSTTAEEAPPGYARRWWVLATMTVCLLVVIMGNTILNVALPTLQRDLDATQAELQAVVARFSGLALAPSLFHILPRRRPPPSVLNHRSCTQPEHGRPAVLATRKEGWT